MTVSSIVAALVVGLAAGGLGWVVVPRRRRVPAWVLVTVGVAAALAGATAARLLGVDASRLRLPEVLIQVAAAALAVAGAATLHRCDLS